jgi:hypothetical protein
VHPYQRGRAWLSGLRLNGWKGMKTGRLVGVARCDLIGLCFGTASRWLRSGGWAESAEMASLHAGKICIDGESLGIASTLKRSGPPLHRRLSSVSSAGNDACPGSKSNDGVRMSQFVVHRPRVMLISRSLQILGLSYRPSTAAREARIQRRTLPAVG